MADETKRKSITSIDEFTEVIDFLYAIYKSIITKRLKNVNRKLRIRKARQGFCRALKE